MKHIVAINASPRTDWNTGTLIREAARGAESEGAEVAVFDLYKLEKFIGCISCIPLLFIMTSNASFSRLFDEWEY